MSIEMEKKGGRGDPPRALLRTPAHLSLRGLAWVSGVQSRYCPRRSHTGAWKFRLLRHHFIASGRNVARKKGLAPKKKDRPKGEGSRWGAGLERIAIIEWHQLTRAVDWDFRAKGRSCHWRRSLLGNVSNGLASLQVAVCAHSLVNSQVLLVVTTQQLCEKNSRHAMGHRGMYLYTVRQSNAGSIGDHHRPMSGAQVGGTVPDLAACPVTLWSTSSCPIQGGPHREGQP